MMPRVFVYGSLLPGESGHAALQGSRCLGPALVQGRLLDLGDYPGLVAGEGLVIGEVYSVSQDTLSALDRIEGFSAQAPASSLFRRSRMEVRYLADGHREKVYTYVHNRRAQGELIAHGDYRRYWLEQRQAAQWVVAYGSNLCRDRLAARVGEPQGEEKGFLRGFELRFNKHAQGGGAACANIAWKGGTATCPAVAWKLGPEQIETLDGYEGTPDHYLRVALRFDGEKGGEQICQGYIAHPDRLDAGLLPTAEYSGHVQSGYRQHGFDNSELPT